MKLRGHRLIDGGVVSGARELRLVGALALGAFAGGALAIGALAVGQILIGRARIGRMEIDELVVRHLHVTDQPGAPPEENGA
jgi:hypothetical protein